ncbi:3-phosphoshikimate 1-carboxyvinyltransferase [Herbaspirillum sp. HC18]|nr:3-phosphoshikimate 1-carboxyvinyltransferase [Herbaspirillum sp. HC18]
MAARYATTCFLRAARFNGFRNMYLLNRETEAKMQAKNTVKNIGVIEDAEYTATIPGSKSYTNRALILASQRVGTTRVKNALICDDTIYLAKALDKFGGLQVTQDGSDFIVTRTAEQLTAPTDPLFVGGAGTPARFLLTFAATVTGYTTVTGNARLSERPMGHILESLSAAGIDWTTGGKHHCLPVTVKGGTPSTFQWTVNGTVSSQFVSSMLLCAAQQKTERVEITVSEGLVSVPYVRMTLAMMRNVGIKVAQIAGDKFIVYPSRPQAEEIKIEVDASGMSYLLTAAALTQSTVTIPGIGEDSVQGDIGLVRAYERMGCRVRFDKDSITLKGAPLQGIDIDMEDMPDVVLSLAIAASQASSPTHITNIANLRVKECDRIAAICNGLGRLGIRTEEGPDWVRIYPGQPNPGVVEAYDDHRVSMAFSLLSLLHDGIELDNHECVAKSFPAFWDEIGNYCRTVGAIKKDPVQA